MRIATNLHLLINEDTMHQYVVGLTALKTMTHMISEKFDSGARAVYWDAMEIRVMFDKDVTL